MQPSQQGSYVDLAGNPNAEGLNGYALGAILSQGPSGLTYDGVRKSDRLRVAIKVLNPLFASQPELVEEVCEDVAAFEGVGVAGGPLDTGKTHGHQVVVYPYQQGQSLTALLAGGPAESRSALEIVRAIAAVVAPAHEHGLGHGDIRPDKVLCGDNGAGLLDFGLARAACLAAGYGQRGITFGHPGYLAPEVLQEDLLEPTPTADVYALGMTLYHVLCGRPPFVGSDEDVLSQHLDGSLPPPPPGVQISKGVAQLLLNMTAKSPTARLRNARTVVDAIDALLGGKRGIVSRESWSVASQAEADQALWASTEHMPLADQLPDLSDALMRSSGRLPREVMSDLLQESKPDKADRGKFNLGELIGRGPVGRTCEGSLGDRPVAVKVISAKFDQHPQVVQTLLDRTLASQALDHPNLVRFVQIIQAKNRTLILQERVQGEPLAKLIADQGKLEVNQALGFAREIAEALGHAHEKGIAHGDVRPAKVFVEAGRARLSDFGYAQANCLGAGFGKDGLPFGHPNYTAAEVFQTPLPEPDPLCDVYGLGVTLYEMICGRVPFEGKPNEVMRKHLSRPIPPPPAEAQVPDAVGELILKLTAKDRARRPQTAADVIEAIDRARKQAAAGASAGPAVEEFDPTQDLLSQADWGQLVASVPKVTGRWSRDRIKQAQAVGPKDWDERSLAEGSAEQSELRKALDAAVIQNAAKASAQGTPRAKAAPKIGEAPEAGNRLTFLVSVGGIALVVLSMIGAAIYQISRRPPPPPTREEVANYVPPPEVVKERELAKELELRVDETLSRFESNLDTKIGRGDFQRAQALFDNLSEDVRQSGHADERLRVARLKLTAAIGEAVVKIAGPVRELIQSGALDRAERELKGGQRAKWATEDATYQQLIGELSRERRARDAKLAALPGLTPEPYDVPKLRQALRKSVKGVRVDTVLPNGGVAVKYSGDGLEALLRDNSLSRNFRTAKLKPAPAGHGMAIYLEPTPGKTGILFHRLTLARPLDATLEFIVDGDLRPLSSVGIVSGFTKNSRRAHGMSWGCETLDYRADDELYNVSHSGDGFDGIEPGKLLRMTYTLSALRNNTKSFELSGSFLSGDHKRPGNKVRVGAHLVQGQSAITLKDVKGWVISLEVRGQFTPNN